MVAMSAQTLSLEEWTCRAYASLRVLSGYDPKKETSFEDGKHFSKWAESLSEEPCNYYAQGYSPEDAVREELSHA